MRTLRRMSDAIRNLVVLVSVIMLFVLAGFVTPAMAGDIITQYQTRFVDSLAYTNATGRDIEITSIFFATSPSTVTNTFGITITQTQDEPLTTNVADTVSVTYSLPDLVYTGSWNHVLSNVILPDEAVLTLNQSGTTAWTNSVVIWRSELN